MVQMHLNLDKQQSGALWQHSRVWQSHHHIFAVTYLAVSAPLVIKVLIKSS